MAKIEAIDESSPYLAEVKKLWRSQSATLGFLPDGGFRSYARERHIVVALDGSNQCVGYLLYRIVREKAIVAHFCVSPAVRRQGYARAMRNWLIQATKKQRGIMLCCRADFEASKTWPRLGFYPIGSKCGRAGRIVIWWLSQGHSDLFTEPELTGAIEAAVDANVFLDLVDGSSDETRGLQADWLLPLVTLCYTPELLIDINRHQDAATQNRRKREAEQFKLLECSAEAYQKAEQELLPLFPNLANEQDESDFRHLVRALAADADVFVTRDEGLLGRADEVYKTSGLSIVRPGELVTQIDTLQREHLYQRDQVAGTNQILQSRVKVVEESLVSTIKTNHERQHEIRQLLSRCLADPQRCQCHEITNSKGVVLAAYAIEQKADIYHIPLFRVCDKRRAATLARSLLTGIVRHAVGARINAVLITDRQVDATACADVGFIPVQEGQLKLVISGWRRVEDVPALLTWSDQHVEKIKAALPAAKSDVIVASALEHLLWPAKLSDSVLPSFIVPIKAKFAEHLCDARLAKGSLFGVDVDLALSPENAYYRAAKPTIVSDPGRVLWYVSKSDRHPGSMSIRACSRIVEVVKSTPKPVFKRFRRLGVYEWADVLETAGSIDTEIMAFRFDDTELLRPIAWNEFQPILKAHGITTTLQSPVEIPADVFGKLYAAALDPPSIR